MFCKEYPRPNLVRKNWKNLNGIWDFEFDDLKIGLKEKWHKHKEFTKKINVPFVFQSELSGINDSKFHDVVWYKRKFKIDSSWKDKEIIINFEAVDYIAKIYINGEFVGEHQGGHVGFSLNITDYLNWNEEEIVVYAFDPSIDQTIPRGKQFWKEQSEGIWYTRSTGIWQTVWLEAVNSKRIELVQTTPNLDKGSVEFLIETTDFKNENLDVELEIIFKDEVISKDIFNLNKMFIKREIDVFNQDIFRGPYHHSGWCWTPETPNLFNYKIILSQNKIKLDEVEGYFGMRKVHIDNGKVYLNNRPYYQKLVLDQGYWPKSLMTAPTDEDLKKDILLSKEMGFNGCRKHQKVESQRFLYWADVLGFLVWGEMPSCIEYNYDSVKNITNEWLEVLKRDYSHPSIVAWVPLNESWGVPRIGFDKKEQDHSLSLYYMLHSLDSTRLVISNDGWELTKSDICAVHNYNHGNKAESKKYNKFIEDIKTKKNILMSEPAGKRIYAKGFKHEGEPILLTEFGGIAYDTTKSLGWGYSVATSEEEFIEDYERVLSAVEKSETVVGFCYTQLCDVEQEINGLLTYDRQPKCSLEVIKSINEKIDLTNYIED